MNTVTLDKTLIYTISPTEHVEAKKLDKDICGCRYVAQYVKNGIVKDFILTNTPAGLLHVMERDIAPLHEWRVKE